MPSWEWTDFDTVEVDPGDLADIRAFVPPEDCLLPESERLANYLMRLLGVMHDGEWKFVQPILTNERCAILNQTRTQADMASYINDMKGIIESMGNNVSAMQTDIAGVNITLENLATINLSIGSLVDKLTLLQVDFSAIKLQIDKLYLDTINVDAGDVSGGGTATAIEKAFMHTQGEDKYSILNTAFLRPEVIPGDEDLRRVGEMVSHVETIQEDLVSLEMTEPTIELAPGTLIYAKSKVVRE